MVSRGYSNHIVANLASAGRCRPVALQAHLIPPTVADNANTLQADWPKCNAPLAVNEMTDSWQASLHAQNTGLLRLCRFE